MYEIKDGKIVYVKPKRHLEDELLKKKKKTDRREEEGTGEDDFYLNDDFEFAEEDDEELYFNDEDKIVNRIFRRKNDINTTTRPDNTRLSLSTNTSKITLASQQTIQPDGRLTKNETMKKYALFSQATYERDINKRNEILQRDGLTKGFFVDEEISGDKNMVFVNKQGEVVLAFKGTNPKNVEDIIDDIAIANPNVNESDMDRFKRADALYDKVIQKYGQNANIKTVGHSLGAQVALAVGEKHDIETHAYNIGMSVNEAVNTSSQNNTNKTYIYRTTNDPVSVGTYFNQNDNREIITVEQKHLFDSHSIDNFTIDEKDTTKSAFDKVENEFDNLLNKFFGVVKDSTLEVIEDEIPEVKEINDINHDSKLNKALDVAVDILKTDERRNEDKLMELAESQKKSTNFETDMNGDIVVKDGVRYVQVEGSNN